MLSLKLVWGQHYLQTFKNILRLQNVRHDAVTKQQQQNFIQNMKVNFQHLNIQGYSPFHPVFYKDHNKFDNKYLEAP